MRNNGLQENFKEEYYNGARNMSAQELSNVRRQRKMSDYIHKHNGEWFSFYDNIHEANQWGTAFSDIVYAFNIIYEDYKNGIDTNTRIFVTCSGKADVTNLSHEIKQYLEKHMKYAFNFITIPETYQESDIMKIRSEILRDPKPSIVVFEMMNHTHDDVFDYDMTEDEIAEIVDQLTEAVLPKSGIVVFMEEYPRHTQDDYEDNDENMQEPEESVYPEGYGTGEIEFDE